MSFCFTLKIIHLGAKPNSHIEMHFMTVKIIIEGSYWGKRYHLMKSSIFNKSCCKHRLIWYLKFFLLQNQFGSNIWHGCCAASYSQSCRAHWNSPLLDLQCIPGGSLDSRDLSPHYIGTYLGISFCGACLKNPLYFPYKWDDLSYSSWSLMEETGVMCVQFWEGPTSTL